MDPNLLKKYARPVPRYTSYPTAPQFHAGIGAEQYGRWLADIPETEPLSLYAHIPFCRHLCWFCGCNTKIVRRNDPVSRYLGTLELEIDLVADTIGRGRNVSHLHWGGGTPNILLPEDITRLAERLWAGFSRHDGTEFAVELDPRTLTQDAVRAFAAAGVTRASLGVQDLDPDVQRAVNRIQPFEMTEHAVTWLRAAGISGINIDLMYGLPGQTVAGVEATADRIVTLAPDRLALFGYAHVPWMKRHQEQIDENALPDPEERAAQSAAVAARLEKAGYRRIGLDHFARADDMLTEAVDHGRLHRNFQGYTTDTAGTLLGFGASAIGALPQGYVQNATPVHTWRDAIENGDFAVTKGVALDEDDRLRRAIIEKLMCEMGVDLAAICAGFGQSPESLAPDIAELDPFIKDGLVALDGFQVQVCEEGRPILRSVAAVFDRYLQSSTGRHSQAV